MWQTGDSGFVIPDSIRRDVRILQGMRTQNSGGQSKWEPADKPGSVVSNHSSGTVVTGGLKQPTRKHRGPRFCFPIWSCSGWGLPCRSVLPPARCALTAPFHPYQFPGGIFSVALSVGSRPPGITWHPALWSPDFPPRAEPEFNTGRLPGRLPEPFSPTRARIDSLVYRFRGSPARHTGHGVARHAVLLRPAPPG